MAAEAGGEGVCAFLRLELREAVEGVGKLWLKGKRSLWCFNLYGANSVFSQFQ
jgi:hypothetical protein